MDTLKIVVVIGTTFLKFFLTIHLGIGVSAKKTPRIYL